MPPGLPRALANALNNLFLLALQVIDYRLVLDAQRCYLHVDLALADLRPFLELLSLAAVRPGSDGLALEVSLKFAQSFGFDLLDLFLNLAEDAALREEVFEELLCKVGVGVLGEGSLGSLSWASLVKGFLALSADLFLAANDLTNLRDVGLVLRQAFRNLIASRWVRTFYVLLDLLRAFFSLGFLHLADNDALSNQAATSRCGAAAAVLGWRHHSRETCDHLLVAFLVWALH